MTKTLVYFATVLVLGLLFLAACDENIISDGPNGTYYIRITVVKDLDYNRAGVTVYMTRDGEVYSAALVNFGNYALEYDYDNSVYTHEFINATTLNGDTYDCIIVDGEDFNDTIMVTIPDSVDITDIALPEDRVNPAGESVQIQWSQSLTSDDYVCAVNHVDSLYETDGYAAFSPDGNPQATVPPDAFRPGGVLDPVLGWYYVYVYSVTGKPTADNFLPGYFPAGLEDNIDETNFTGSYGVVVISHRDSINVTESL